MRSSCTRVASVQPSADSELAMADALAQMQALLEQYAPPDMVQQARAQAQAIREADRRRREDEAAEAAGRDAIRADERLMSDTKQNPAIRVLLHMTERTSTNQAKKLLPPARTALTALLSNALAGENQAKLESLLGQVQQLLSGSLKLPNNGPIGKKRAALLLGALLSELGLRPEDVDDDPEDDPLVGPGGQVVLWSPEQDGEPDDDEPDDFAAVERPQKSPSEFPGTPQPVVDVRCAQHASRGGRVCLLTVSQLTPSLAATQAYTAIMDIDKLRESLRFELVPFLRRVHDHIVALKADRQAERPAYMLGGGKCQSRKTYVNPLEPG